MANVNKIFMSVQCSVCQSSKILPHRLTLRSCSNYSKLPEKRNNDSKLSEKRNNDTSISETEKRKSIFTFKDSVLSPVTTKYWNETKAVKKLRKENTYPRNVDNIVDLLNELVRFRVTFPGTFKGFLYWLRRKRERRELLEQLFLPKRQTVLKPDLAAAHFLVRRGGAVKFIGQPHWTGIRRGKSALPNTFVPGMYVEAVDLEGTNLYYEGLRNISDLKYLKSMSLKNLEHVNDWWLDWISAEYHLNLKHLDLTGCKNVTYRGLSCFYRFENLKSLNVEGVPDPPEFKLACIMLQDIMPELDIRGTDLSVPEEIKAVGVEEGETLSSAKAHEKLI